jgi:NDP-sugar pyrophosphorylase family protein
MKAVVLASGLGKRMRPLTNDRPKALVEFKGKPLLEHVLESLEKAGVEEAVIVVGYFPDLVKKRFGKRFGKVRLKYALQRIPMGTGHAVLQAKGKVRGKFLVCYGDVIVEPGLWKRLWKKQVFEAVVAVRPEKNPERFGVALTKGGKLVRIVEKPKTRVESSLVNAGAYAFSQKVFSALKGIKLSPRGEFELTDAVNALASKGKAGFVLYKGKCLDIGTLKELRLAEKA